MVKRPCASVVLVHIKPVEAYFFAWRVHQLLGVLKMEQSDRYDPKGVGLLICPKNPVPPPFSLVELMGSKNLIVRSGHRICVFGEIHGKSSIAMKKPADHQGQLVSTSDRIALRNHLPIRKKIQNSPDLILKSRGLKIYFSN